MATEEDIQKLKDARDKIAEVYESQATDDLTDNGNLTKLNNAILSVNESIKEIQSQG